MKLRREYLSLLPLEICRKVAGYLVQECAAVTSQELVLRTKSVPEAPVYLSEDIDARYIIIDGIIYIGSIHNTSSHSSDGIGARLFKAQEGRIVRNIHIGYDHLGIRHILFDSSREDLRKLVCTTPGAWWAGLSKEEGGIICLTPKTDVSILLNPCLAVFSYFSGLKLRGLLDSTVITPNDGPILPGAYHWPGPGEARRIIDLATCQAPQMHLPGCECVF